MIKIEFKSEFNDILIEYNDNELNIISANLNNQNISSKIYEQYLKDISTLNNLINNFNINVSGYIQINELKKNRYILDDDNYKDVISKILIKLQDKDQIKSLCNNYIQRVIGNDESISKICASVNDRLLRLNELIKQNKSNDKYINQFNLNILKFEIYNINKPNELNIHNDLYELNKYIEQFNLVDNNDIVLTKMEHSSNHLNIHFTLSYMNKSDNIIYHLTLRKLSSIIQLQSLVIQYYQMLRDNNILTPKETRGRKEGMLIGTKYKKHIIKSNNLKKNHNE